MKTTARIAVAWVAVLMFSSPMALAMQISGAANIIDGDTLTIGSQVIRLYGIDAPENGQSCTRKNGSPYQCGVASENALKALVQGKTSCEGAEFDTYSRLIAVCRSNGIDINRELVRMGHALAFRRFSEAYIADEQFASDSARGMWEGSFETPWDFRAGKWKSAVEVAPTSGCPIKGNINGKGEKIYHTPWSRSYERTRINTERSERWFCTEAEALAAGWRAPYR